MSHFATKRTTDEVVASLAPVNGRLWERHGYRRIYVDVQLACNGARASLDKPQDVRFYLNLETEIWMLTGRIVDRAIVAYLNGLTGINFLTQVTKHKEAETSTPAPEMGAAPQPQVKAVPHRRMDNDELRLLSDDTLITLIKTSDYNYDDKNLWALRISWMDGVSLDVITALIEADKNWYENRLIVRQKNFPAGFQERLIRRGNHNRSIARYFASDASEASADMLHFLAMKSTSKTVLKEVAGNINTPLDALLYLRKKMLVPALIKHRDTTDELLADLAREQAYALLILTEFNRITGPVAEVLKASGDPEIRKLLASSHGYLLPAAEMLDYTASLTVEDLKAWAQNVPDEMVMELLKDARQTVVRNTRDELMSRGYVEQWVKPSN